jgi:hypothetical protein
MSYIKTGDVENKIRAESLNNWDDEEGLNWWGLKVGWEVF